MSALAGAVAAAETPDGPTSDADQRAVVSVPDRRAMAALPPGNAGGVVFLGEAGRSGNFLCIAGKRPADDPLQGLYVPSETPGTYYARIWDETHGRPEWFGAAAGNPEVDCAGAIEACYSLCPVTELAAADYFIRRTLQFGRSWRTVRGSGRYASDQGQGTRIILHRSAARLHTADIVLVGTIDRPSGGGARGEGERLTCGNHLSNLTLLRDGACTPHLSGDIVRYPAGLRASYLYHCTFAAIASLESSVGFYIGGTVYTKFDDCLSRRALAGTEPLGDYAFGYYIDGHVSFGYAGGNASLYLNRCLTFDQHPAHVDASGLKAKGAFVDTFIDHFESARIATGISCDVDSARSGGQSIDLHIRNPVLDGCAKFGIHLDLDQTSSASIEIIDPYIYSAGGGGDRGIAVGGGAGLVTITGGQVHGDFAGGSLWFSRTRGIRVQGTKLQQSVRPVVVAEASGLHLEPQINNYAKTSNNFAIDCGALTRSTIRPVIIGAAAPAFRGGVSLDKACGRVVVDGSAIDPACFISADAGDKVWFDGADARTVHRDAFAGAKNILAGVTD